MRANRGVSWPQGLENILSVALESDCLTYIYVIAGHCPLSI